jgi:outer membrane protein OmpA-like peptidoglycan-associated protein
MRSTGVHLVDGRCTLVVVDHDDDAGPRVVDHRSVDLAVGVIAAGRIADADALAPALAEIVAAAQGQVIVAWWPDDALLSTIDCTGVTMGGVGEAVDRVVVERFGANRPSVVLRKVIASGRELTTVGACRSFDLENARRALLRCGLEQASLILAPVALATLTRDLHAPVLLAAGGERVALLYGFAGWPFVGGALSSDADEPVAQMCDVGALSAIQYRSLRPPMAHLGAARVFESSATLESIARDLLTPTGHGNGMNGAAHGTSLESVDGDYLVALGAALWGASTVADLVPSGLSVLPGVAAPLADEPETEDPVVIPVEHRRAPRHRGRVLIAAAVIVLALGAVGTWFATSVDERAEPAVSTEGIDAIASTVTVTAPSSASSSTTTEVASTLPFVAHAHGGVYRQGKIYLEGTLPSRAKADAFVKKAAAVIGSSNVIDNYVIDARAPTPSSGFVRVDEPFLFPTGSATLDAQYLGVLDLGVIVMNQNERARMIVTGHTDSVGDEDANQRLSLRRANAVVDYIVSKGVERSRFDAVGKGETSPIADNAFESGRQLNRRIEVELLGLLDAD